MRTTRGKSVLLLMAICCWLAIGGGAAQPATIGWKDCLGQKPEWYASAEAVRIADNLLLFQREIGGWQKNVDMARHLTEAEKADAVDQKEQNDSTIDNDATTTQMIYLARVFNATTQERYKAAFLKGMDYLLKMQYPNGGWPQYYPRLTGYYKHITFNDNAMVNVMTLLGEVAQKRAAYSFVDESRRAKAATAVLKGIECVLNCQVKVNGKLTVWCAQHDEVTFAPAPARAYEKISLSGSESVGIVRFLMGIERPTPAIIDAIESAVAWFKQNKLMGIKLVKKPDASLPKGYDTIVVADAKAEPLWARFYEIGTNRPIFCGRDSIIKFSLAEIEYERRNGYNWYTNAAAKLLAQDYPAWQKQLAAGKNAHGK